MGDTYLSFFIILHSIFLGLFMVDLSKKLNWDWISIKRYFIDDFKIFNSVPRLGENTNVKKDIF